MKMLKFVFFLNKPIVLCSSFLLSVETKTEQKNFLDLLTIPGCFLIFLHATMLRVAGHSFSTSIGGYMIVQVRFVIDLFCIHGYTFSSF